MLSQGVLRHQPPSFYRTQSILRHFFTKGLAVEMCIYIRLALVTY